MPDYHRYYIKGGTYFFTIVSYKRSPIFRKDPAINLLNYCFKTTMDSYPFTIDAMVILPDHLHTIWTLPDNDSNYSIRWQQIKATFSKNFRGKDTTNLPESLARKGEKGIWQRRFWEHLIRDQEDFNNHCDYIHYNPVKHGLAKSPLEWKHSTFGKFVEERIYDADWGQSVEKELIEMNLE